METIKVEQCDRDAAQPFMGDAVHYGHLDEHLLIQAFARHRIAERERCAGIVEARVEPSWHPAAKNGAKLIAQAIREQSNGA